MVCRLRNSANNDGQTDGHFRGGDGENKENKDVSIHRAVETGERHHQREGHATSISSRQ